MASRSFKGCRQPKFGITHPTEKEFGRPLRQTIAQVPEVALKRRPTLDLNPRGRFPAVRSCHKYLILVPDLSDCTPKPSLYVSRNSALKSIRLVLPARATSGKMSGAFVGHRY